ncbi:MAG TPA: PLP-dependent aminotransferase family protein [Gemmatimonadaceae bacterium]|nr:PLP-dependent aminotransferase family protein [Gemmatimonadaceae bacterium]
MTNWKPRLASRAGPTYRAIADALETDVREGRLAPGDALPTQRDLARAIGVNFTTVTRGYAEARRRGLINATVGRGTFVASREVRASGDHDMSVNTPPIPDWLSAAFRETLTRVAGDPSLARQVLSYDLRFGDGTIRDAGASWLRGRGLEASADRVVPSAGALHGLSLVLNTFARPGHRVVTESLAYPGLHSVAAAAGVRLVGVAIDDEGLIPDSLEAACKKYKPKMLCCVPSFQNPTTAVMSLARRRDILTIARRYGLRVVEDDICGPLLSEPAPPLLATLAPDIVTYVGSLSKCVAPGLRTAFVLAPTAEEAARLDTTLRAAMLMLSPLPLVVASAWILDGTASRAATDIRREAAARTQLARSILGVDRVAAPDGSLHGWLRLPASSTVAAFVAKAQERGVRVTPADWYVTPSPGEGIPVPRAVRFTLGNERDRARIEQALRTLASILAQDVGPRTSI